MLSDDLAAAIAPQFRGRLLARGQAQSMIRRDGTLPEGAPSFDAFLDEDLLGYGYSLISTSLRIIENSDLEEPTRGTATDSNENLARDGFIHASYALEAATRNASNAELTAFHRLIAGAASHLGGYAARAYSLVQTGMRSGRLTPMEQTLADLITRALDDIEERARRLRSSPNLTDDAVLAALLDPREEGSRYVEPVASTGELGPLALLLSENYMSAVATALFALAHGQPDLLTAALDDLQTGERASHDMSAPGPWWVYRLTRRLLDDLAQTSISANIPTQLPPVGAATFEVFDDRRERRWRYLRRTFVATLFARRRSEIDLWPSQLHVVDRIFDGNHDLVVALPTSAGKTRIAELCILSCLAQGRRAVYVTPLRALSAQTEQVLDRTFAPLGVRVSSLYGSMGVSDVDEDALRTSQIVVATPEKLDFALRLNPAVLDDVGLIVLDEGHMIGPSEREIRYEAQIQRLLRRPDAHARRIVCLSAVFPSGEDLNDFVSWITDETPDGLHREEWRPTLQRFGLVEWRGDHARLSMTVGEDRPYIPRFLEATAPTRPRQKPFPADQRELVIATAWRLVEEGQTALIFCPQRNSVEPYAREVIKLRRQGFIDSVLPADVDLSGALMIGAEWFGDGHPILECLKLGVAIHHGALPGPFRREVERLLHAGVIKVTVASPTLAQGLNLSASVVLFHGLRRGQALLTGAEFSNVIGRAGRAFVDTEGLVLYPIFESAARRRREWLQLTSGDASKTLRSGLIEVSIALVRRITASIRSEELQPFLDYLTGGPEWTLPVVEGVTPDQQQEAAQDWRSNLALLDAGILSIVGDDDSDPDEITQLIADALRGSLWERQLQRLDAAEAAALREVVTSRARFIWSTSTPAQRRGWYLAGLGVNAGRELAQVASDVIGLIALAEAAIADEDYATATAWLEQIATTIFSLPPFQPETRLRDWREILARWVGGRPLGEFETSGPADRVTIAQFIESDLIYRLVWGMEAARVYEDAQGNPAAATLDGSALTAIETGTLLRPASILIRAGFDHRGAAISAVEAANATFDSLAAMRDWIAHLDPEITSSPDWPTTESHEAWLNFANRAIWPQSRRWRKQTKRLDDVTWTGPVPQERSWLRVTNGRNGEIELWSPGYDPAGTAEVRVNPSRQGILHARRLSDGPGVELDFWGPDDPFNDEQ
ncbi:DEAD/DEAH box helicase [Saccharopolyspora sp. ASAGF58]|uniref:DEAD/DEAH box helicase n=1 Tax=Saccharopolyspora sp. ASAGF58 TaxID=2719023 RepID=UPI001446BB0E|nr:DEAD/DEAH box helicase [Saccharopolyspora sp. ASAGF58]